MIIITHAKNDHRQQQRNNKMQCVNITIIQFIWNRMTINAFERLHSNDMGIE